MQALIEQRKDSRSSVAWPVSVWIPEANRFVNGRSCNISKTGVFVTLPLTAPIRTGHLVEICSKMQRSALESPLSMSRSKALLHGY